MKLSSLAALAALGSLSLLGACSQSGSGTDNVANNVTQANTSTAADQARQTADDVHSEMENRHGGDRMMDDDHQKMEPGMGDNAANMTDPGAMSDDMDNRGEM